MRGRFGSPRNDEVHISLEHFFFFFNFVKENSPQSKYTSIDEQKFKTNDKYKIHVLRTELQKITPNHTPELKISLLEIPSRCGLGKAPKNFAFSL